LGDERVLVCDAGPHGIDDIHAGDKLRSLSKDLAANVRTVPSIEKGAIPFPCVLAGRGRVRSRDHLPNNLPRQAIISSDSHGHGFMCLANLIAAGRLVMHKAEKLFSG
jgi:hypothetical protein